MHGDLFERLDRETFLDRITPFLAELNAIHPFREGNGRAQLAFVGLLGATFAHPLNFELLDRETFLSAIIASYFGDLQFLRGELNQLLK